MKINRGIVTAIDGVRNQSRKSHLSRGKINRLPMDPHCGCARLLNHPSNLCFSVKLNFFSEKKTENRNYHYIKLII